LLFNFALKNALRNIQVNQDGLKLNDTHQLLAYADVNTLATGYGDFRTSVASGRRRATEISVFVYGWLEEGFGLCCVLALMLYNHNISLEKVCTGP